MVSKFAMFAQKWSKIAAQKKVDSWEFANQSAVAVGVSYM